MQVFISWSGDLSRQLAEVIRDWLPSALQFVKPYFTPNDIDKGAKWASEISTALSSSSICVIVLTQENLSSSWIMFEAGAISSTLDNSRVCPIVFGLEPVDLQGPLAQFQVTRFVQDDFRRLFQTINNQAGENKLTDANLQRVFDKWWPDLEQQLSKILQSQTKKPPAKQIRSDRDLLEELLLLVRNQATEKEQQRVSAPRYEGSFVQAAIQLLKELIEADGRMDRHKIRNQLAGLYMSAERKLVESEATSTLLGEISEMIRGTRAGAPTQRRAPSPPLAEDDDIPF